MGNRWTYINMACNNTCCSYLESYRARVCVCVCVCVCMCVFVVYKSVPGETLLHALKRQQTAPRSGHATFWRHGSRDQKKRRFSPAPTQLINESKQCSRRLDSQPSSNIQRTCYWPIAVRGTGEHWKSMWWPNEHAGRNTQGTMKN